MNTFELLTVSFPNNTGIDFLLGSAPDNYDKMRGRPLSTKGNISRDSLMSFTKSSIVYHKRMDRNNAMVINDDIDNITPTLSYEDEQKKALQVSKIAEQ